MSVWELPMAKPNYSFQKRQRDLAKKQKKEEKRLRKAGAKEDGASDSPGDDNQATDAEGAGTEPEGRPAAE